MKKLLLLSMLLISLTAFSQTDAVLGGAGICDVDQDPDLITDMQTQDERYECLVAWDEDNQVLYIYDGSLAVGSRWADYSTLLTTTTNTDTRLSNPTISGGNLSFDIIDLGGNTVGTESIPVLSIAPVQNVDASTGISVSNTTGTFTITNTAPESTTITDGNTIDLTKTGSDISAEVILDNAGNNALTSSASGLKVVLLDNDPNNENQTVSNGSGISVTQTGQDYQVTNTEASQGEYKNHADAGVGGVNLGEYFDAKQGNTMGLPAGVNVKRKF